MGVWDFMRSSRDQTKQNAPNLSLVKNARWSSYNIITLPIYAVKKINNTVRVNANGIQRIYSSYWPDAEARAKIALFAKIFTANTADYAMQEGIKLIPGGKAFSKIVSQTLRDVKSESNKKQQMKALQKKVGPGEETIDCRNLIEQPQDAKSSKKFAFEIIQAFDDQNKSSVSSHHELISWSCPPPGTIKINSDGSTFGDYGWAAYGGLARDSYGRWIEGFCGRICYATPLQAELWGIRRAMKLANEKEWLEAVVETDSFSAVNLINNNEEIGNHPDKTLIQDCRNLKESMLIELVHVLREGNKCADYMSKLGRVQGGQAMRVMVPTNPLVQLLKADMQGIAYMRGD